MFFLGEPDHNIGFPTDLEATNMYESRNDWDSKTNCPMCADVCKETVTVQPG